MESFGPHRARSKWPSLRARQGIGGPTPGMGWGEQEGKGGFMSSATCCTCHKSIVVLRDGSWHVHGPVSHRCPGSREQHLAAPAQQVLGATAGIDAARKPRVVISPKNATTFSPFVQHGKILKQIPSGARDAARPVYRHGPQFSWETGSHGGALCLPSRLLGSASEREGMNHNMKRAVIRHIQRFKKEGVIALSPFPEAVTEPGSGRCTPLSADAAAAKRVAGKLDEGDIKSAIHQLCFTDSVAQPSLTMLQLLLPKHPPAPADRCRPAPIDSYKPLLVSIDQVLGAIKSFPAGSSGGPDKLCPQHLKDMMEKQVGSSLLASLTKFVNFILAGKVPEWVRLFGASLLAFAKKDGG